MDHIVPLPHPTQANIIIRANPIVKQLPKFSQKQTSMEKFLACCMPTGTHHIVLYYDYSSNGGLWYLPSQIQPYI